MSNLMNYDNWHWKNNSCLQFIQNLYLTTMYCNNDLFPKKIATKTTIFQQEKNLLNNTPREQFVQ